MKSITQHYTIHASVDDVWQAFTNPLEINAWGGGPAVMSDEMKPFSLWGGDIHGENISVIKNKEIKQQWYSEDWKQASIVTFVFSHKDSDTNITLVHEQIPDNELKEIEAGWNVYYIGAIKTYLESKTL